LLDDDHILQEPNPYATISKGLAQIPYLRKTLEDRKKKLQDIFLGENGKSNTIIYETLEILKKTFIASCLSDSGDSIWIRYIKPIILDSIQKKFEDRAYGEDLDEQLRDMKNDILRLWRGESKRASERLKHLLQKEFREAASDNNLTLSLNLDVNLQDMSFENLFDSLFPKEAAGSFIGSMLNRSFEWVGGLWDHAFESKKRKASTSSIGSIFSTFIKLLCMPFRWIGRLWKNVFKSKKKTAREAQKWEEKRKQYEEKLKTDIDAFFSKKPVKEKIQEQIRGPVASAIKAIELLQSQV
jgi:hypothetical protein